jgi:gliding motility-associated protein GldC
MSKNEIKLTLELDENKVPETILWRAEGAEDDNQFAKAFILAIWDKESANTLKMDLWTKEMSVEEMKKFYFQTFVTMADSFQKSTSEDGMADAIRDFADFFGEKLGVIPSTGKFDK